MDINISVSISLFPRTEPQTLRRGRRLVGDLLKRLSRWVNDFDEPTQGQVPSAEASDNTPGDRHEPRERDHESSTRDAAPTTRHSGDEQPAPQAQPIPFVPAPVLSMAGTPILPAPVPGFSPHPPSEPSPARPATAAVLPAPVPLDIRRPSPSPAPPGARTNGVLPAPVPFITSNSASAYSRSPNSR